MTLNLPALVPQDNLTANARTKAHFETAIANSWRSNVAGIILTGDLLKQADDELDREVSRALRLPFGPRTAQMLRRIADHPIVSDHANHGSLPPCWRTLYELTKVPDDLLRAALADGRIHSALQRKDIRGQILGLPPRAKQQAPDKLQHLLNTAPIDECRRAFNVAGKTRIGQMIPPAWGMSPPGKVSVRSSILHARIAALEAEIQQHEITIRRLRQLGARPGGIFGIPDESAPPPIQDDGDGLGIPEFLRRTA